MFFKGFFPFKMILHYLLLFSEEWSMLFTTKLNLFYITKRCLNESQKFLAQGSI